jgi:hypothetical protein
VTYWHNNAQPQSRDTEGIFPLDGKDLASVTDEALATLITTAPIIHQLGGTTVVRLSEKLIMKGGGSVLASEAKMLSLIASRASIRIPRIHRTFQVEDHTQYFGTSGYIVMDFIQGQPLDECWNGLSLDTQGGNHYESCRNYQRDAVYWAFTTRPYHNPALLVEGHAGLVLYRL